MVADLEPWEAPDGTRWLYFPQFGEWHGWQPGEDGLWVRTEAEFAAMYSDCPKGCHCDPCKRGDCDDCLSGAY